MKSKSLISVDAHLEDGFKASGTSPPSKTCSMCKISKFANEYYSKGNRSDSCCKDCQKQKKKTKYVATKNKDVVTGLTAIIEITTSCFKKRIEMEIKKLDEVILCHQKPKP